MKSLQERLALWTERGPWNETLGSFCLDWTGHRNACGYGRIRVNRRRLKAHRAAWELAYGPIPDNLCALHKCDRPACLNTDHLFLGTIADNNADMVAKGRSARGESNGNARFSDVQVARVHKLRARGMLQREIAALTDMSRQHVGDILRGKRRAAGAAEPKEGT